MAANISQKEYLKKYLSGGKSCDVKKKKKKRPKGAGLQIIDDDVDVSKLQPLDSAEIDILLDGNEDAPQIAGIVDERPEEVKKMEQFRLNSKWRVLTEDDGFNSKVRIEEVKGKRIRSEEQTDLDANPPRNISRKTDFKTGSSNKQNQQYITHDSEESPPRKVRSPEVKKSSPPRKKSDRNQHKTSQKSDSDISPPRKSKRRKSVKSDSDISPPRKSTHRRAEKEDSDISPPRKSRKSISKKSDSDTSPPRESRQKSQPSDSDQSPVRKRRPDGDVSPLRKTTKRTERKSRWGYFEDPDKTASDDTRVNPNNQKRQSSCSPDASPPRGKRIDHSPNRNAYKHRRRDVSEDLSPPRKRSYDSTERYKKDQGHPQSSSSRQDRTLEGKKAGFRDAKQFLQEDAEFRRREHDMLHNMADNVSGRNAQTVTRKTGRKRQPSIDKEQQERDSIRQKEREEKYTRWGRGLKQTEETEGRVRDYLHESNKPMARYQDDEDLEVMLKKQEREGDPMANYMREKRGESGPVAEAKPIYKGSYPPNRFQIRPGYRWDGVDRSNGYENKYFESKNSKIALEKDAYKWSTEDM